VVASRQGKKVFGHADPDGGPWVIVFHFQSVPGSLQIQIISISKQMAKLLYYVIFRAMFYKLEL